MSLIQVNVPDIGDFSDVEVIEIFVAVGDTIKEDQSLLTVESDKASMEIPSSSAGVVKALHVKLGDKINEGTLILEVEGVATQAAPTAKVEKPVETEPVATPVVAPVSVGNAPADGYDVMVLGAGPGGYSAAFRAADLGLKVALVERYPTLGGVCLNVGCIPSKALLHTIAAYEEAMHLAKNGIHFGKPEINIDEVRKYKSDVVGRLTSGLAAMAKARKVDVIQGVGQFKDAYHIDVTTAEGVKTIAFKHAIVAAGSQSVKLPFLPEDPRIVDSTGTLELPFVPKRMLVIGGGIIGLEMATVYSGLGARIDVVEMQDGLMQGADRDAVKVWQKTNAHRFDNIMTSTKTVSAEAKEDGIYVTFEGAKAPAEPQRYDLVLQAVGRTPNGRKIGLENTGVQVNDYGFIPVDRQLRTNVSHIFAIGDIIGQPMLAHKAVHEAHVAAEVIAGEKSYFDARVIPSVAYTDPEVAWVGVTQDEAKAEGIDVEVGMFPWMASGRAIANGRDEGFTKLIFDTETKRIIGGTMVGTHVGDMIGEVALAIEMGADAIDIGKTIHPHPTLGESIGMAAEAAHGHCTDLPPVRKKRS